MFDEVTLFNEVRARINEGTVFIDDTTLKRFTDIAVTRVINDIGGVFTKIGIPLKAGVNIYTIPRDYGIGRYSGSDHRQYLTWDIKAILSAEYKGRPLRVINSAHQKNDNNYASSEIVAVEHTPGTNTIALYGTPVGGEKQTTMTADGNYPYWSTASIPGVVTVVSTSGFSPSGYISIKDSSNSYLVRYSGITQTTFDNCVVVSPHLGAYEDSISSGSTVMSVSVVLDCLVSSKHVDALRRVNYVPPAFYPALVDLICSLCMERSGEMDKAQYYLINYQRVLSTNGAAYKNEMVKGLPLFNYDYPE